MCTPRQGKKDGGKWGKLCNFLECKFVKIHSCCLVCFLFPPAIYPFQSLLSSFCSLSLFFMHFSFIITFWLLNALALWLLPLAHLWLQDCGLTGLVGFIKKGNKKIYTLQYFDFDLWQIAGLTTVSVRNIWTLKIN